MIFSREERLEDIIVRILASTGALDVERIHRLIKEQKAEWSIAATYKVLKKLAENGILVYGKRRYALSKNWVLSISMLVDQYFERGVDTDAHYILPIVGASIEWRYTDLRRLNSFASHLIQTAAISEHASVIYSWNPHLWFNLIQDRHEREYYRFLHEIGAQIFKLIGDNSPLDREMAKLLPSHVVKYKYIGSRIFLPEHSYIVVVGQYLITMKLLRQTAAEIDRLFAESKDIKSIDLRLFLKIFKQNKNPSILSIQNNRAKCDLIVEKFKKLGFS